MKELRIYLAEHACQPTLRNHWAKVVGTEGGAGVEVRCGWPECNALLATLTIDYPDEPVAAAPKVPD